MNKPQTSVIDQLESAGCKAAFLPYHCIRDIEIHYRKLAEKYSGSAHIQGALKRFLDYEPQELPFKPVSFLIIACQSSPGRVVFRVSGKRVAVPVPPTYLDYWSENKQQFDSVLETAVKGYNTSSTKGISQKLLAVMSGLGRYGHNNICYVNGFGSYCNLKAYYTDIPCDDISYPPAFMDECGTCGLCSQACPTGAIENTDGGHWFINAARCLTMLNENSAPMPEWVPPDIHHTLIGCLRCQENCAQNRVFAECAPLTLELDEAETQSLFSADFSPLPAELEKKLSGFGMYKDFLDVLVRNTKLALPNMQ